MNTKPWPQALALSDLCRLDATLEAGIAALEHAGLDVEQRMRRSREFRAAHALVRAELDRRVSGRAVREAIRALKDAGYFASYTVRAAS